MPDFADLSARVYRLCLAMLGNESDARDAAQEALSRAWAQREKKRRDVAWWTWSGGFAVRVCRELHRTRKPFEPLDSEMLASNEQKETLVHEPGRTHMASLHQLILRLPERQREVLILRVILKRSTEEAAQMLQCPEGTIKSNLHKAIQRLHALQAAAG